MGRRSEGGLMNAAAIASLLLLQLGPAVDASSSSTSSSTTSSTPPSSATAAPADPADPAPAPGFFDDPHNTATTVLLAGAGVTLVSFLAFEAGFESERQLKAEV